DSRLHRQTVHAILLKRLVICASESLSILCALHMPHDVRRFANADGAIVHNWPWLDATTPCLGINR
ncbi:hypothetical protein, partial [Xanthomonas perforans]|uniref:hypothetical protein n=1 Tax=Xanthomonas perforans TaxID=442694 RepID=UPI001F3E4F57